MQTASLIAASCRSSAVFSGMTLEVKEAMYDYGKHLGLAFQVVDDILDFTQTSEQLGKPQGQDLASGNLTAPAIYALRNCPELVRILFVQPCCRAERRGMYVVVSCSCLSVAPSLPPTPWFPFLRSFASACAHNRPSYSHPSFDPLPRAPRHRHPQEELIQSEFAEPDSLKRAIELVVSSGGVEAARQLARDEADKALAAINVLPASPAKRSLELMVDYVLDRIY